MKMNYYERKETALHIIDELIEKGSFTIEDINLAVLKNTLLGKGFVNNYIDDGLKRGAYEIEKKNFYIRILKNQTKKEKKEE